ncbi:hypothetical protein K0C01_06060 [Salinarchaeum sp. IM2453]|uniref:DUF7470 family protein n=1 Tax=Salinarchaeum sp. IM2453 TaxID=2862870 RepID=UPI001C833456|nr:hypothetical protein [Salinarchaeum sp. IM2453]QZA89683.1 hypothetical protein K0C01_06060 [Salinarchaeum sp. IM2453]
MLDKLGATGIVGILVVFAGVGVIAWENWIIAVGLALVIIGTALLVKSLVSAVVSAMGMGGMF